MELPYRTASGEKPPVGGTIILLAVIAGVVGYIAYQNDKLGIETLIYLAVLVPSIILHEISHGWLANMFGDRTAKRAGRLTLNPLRHFDAVGTFIVPGILILTTNSAFGWAKPVPVNVSQMSRNKAMFVALVGPATNIVLALIAAIGIHLAYDAGHVSMSKDAYYWTIFTLVEFGRVNVILAVFNLIPFPPLDGSSVVERFLPQRYMQGYLQFRQFAIIALLIVMVISIQQNSSLLSRLFDPAIRLWVNLLP
jgi:Zn-dependent protease